MAKKVDIIDVMLAVHKGDLKIVIQNGYFLLEHTKSGERVRLNETEAVEAVRCKNYKYSKIFTVEDNPMYSHLRCCRREHYTEGVDGYGFCSYGERRTDNA